MALGPRLNGPVMLLDTWEVAPVAVPSCANLGTEKSARQHANVVLSDVSPPGTHASKLQLPTLHRVSMRLSGQGLHMHV